MPEPKVRIRCGRRGCSRVLAELYAAADYAAAIEAARSAPEWGEQLARVRRTHAPPPDWRGSLRVQPCPKHDGFRRSFAAEVRERAAAGYDDLRPQITYHRIAWVSLAPAFRLADQRKKTTSLDLADMLQPQVGDPSGEITS